MSSRYKKKMPRFIENVPIHGIADRGKGVGRAADGIAVFVDGAVPGDVVDVFVQKKKSGFAEGRIERILTPSPHRIEPFCQHFEQCGGCKWQHLDYAVQLSEKQKMAEDALERIGKVFSKEKLPIIGADATRFYRNKLEFAFSNKRWLDAEAFERGDSKFVDGVGFHVAGAFDRIIDIEKCWLMAEPSNAVRLSARKIAQEQQLEFYDARSHEGFVRNLMFRLTTTGEMMVLVSFKSDAPSLFEPFLTALLAENPAITTLVYCINPKVNDYLFDLEMRVFSGKGFVEERLGDLVFKIGPKSFFQTNTHQGKKLYDTALDFAGLTGTENVYDLYTGTGSIALFLAKNCRQVVGIEEIPEAIDDARLNQKTNGIDNAIFYAGDVKDILSEAFWQKHGRPDVIVTDPPRAGMHPKAVGWLLELAAPRIVYVSCNPATQARDLAMLAEKYEVLKTQAVDMFPHTHHIENVALLELKK